MLKNNYQEIIVGMGPMSLIRGIISMKRKKTTLLIDDKRFLFSYYPGQFVSKLELLALSRLGKKFDIPELVDVGAFVVPGEVELVTDHCRLKLGRGPLANVKELLRKYPELLNSTDLDEVFSEKSQEFDVFFLEELARFEKHLFESSQRPKGGRFNLEGRGWLKTLYQRFEELLVQEYSQSQTLKYSLLLHLLGISHEEKLKTSLKEEDALFYFFRTLSPVYRLQEFFLSSQLKRRLLLLGGDYKESTIQFWQFHQNKFENLLLASFEGVISGERVLFFSHLPVELPFSIRCPYPFFRKTELSPLKKDLAPFPPSRMIYLANSHLLGSERPFRSIGVAEGVIQYQMPYPEMPGSRPAFFEKELREHFDHDAETYPLAKISMEVSSSGGGALDLRIPRPDKKNDLGVLAKIPLQIEQDGHLVKGFDYWGPHRYRSYGLVAQCYGIESP